MSLYDLGGNVIGTDATAIKSAFMSLVASGDISIGSVPGQTLGYNVSSANYLTNGEAQYEAMLEVYKTLDNSAIPFFISTDQHNGLVEYNRWANNLDKDGLEFANLNLGDTVSATNWEQFASIESKTKLIKNYISTPGNHEYMLPAGEDPDMPTPYIIKKTFFSTYPRTVIDANSDTYVVVDGLHNVKFVASDNYWMNGSVMQNQSLTGSFCEAVIAELSKDDFDIVFLQHWYPYAVASELLYRDGTARTGYNPGGAPAIRTLLGARKAKSNGSVTDADGVSHAYDFRNMKHDLLCCLSGHMHLEMYGYLDGVLCYIADAIVHNTASCFGIVDRQNGLLRIWAWNDNSALAELDLPLTQT